MLTEMLRAAQAERHAIAPQLLTVRAPAKSVGDRDALSVEQAVAMLGAAAERRDGSRWAAALLQGLRQGEALGLTWDQVDLDAGVLTVSWQLQGLPYRSTRDIRSGFRVPDGFEARQLRGRWHLVRPKSRAGWRVVPLVPWMVAALTASRDLQVAEKHPNRHRLVWPIGPSWGVKYVGGPRTPKADLAAWHDLQETVGGAHPAGRPFGVHEARHTTATLLLEAGVDPAVITAILGHSSIVTSRGYQHVRTAPLAEAMAKVADRLALGSGAK